MAVSSLRQCLEAQRLEKLSVTAVIPRKYKACPRSWLLSRPLVLWQFFLAIALGVGIKLGTLDKNHQILSVSRLSLPC